MYLSRAPLPCTTGSLATRHEHSSSATQDENAGEAAQAELKRRTADALEQPAAAHRGANSADVSSSSVNYLFKPGEQGRRARFAVVPESCKSAGRRGQAASLTAQQPADAARRVTNGVQTRTLRPRTAGLSFDSITTPTTAHGSLPAVQQPPAQLSNPWLSHAVRVYVSGVALA